MAYLARSSFMFLMALMVFCQANSVNEIDMDENCGRTITIGESGGTLDSQSGQFYSNDLDCTVSIESSSFVKQILLTFDRVNIDGTPPCTTGDVLEIYDGLSAVESHKVQTVCGSTSKPAESTSSLNHITLRFKTDNETQKHGFLIVYTAFSLGTCKSTEFKCGNGRCIDGTLKNNLYDNCGDSSDEYDDPVKTVRGILQWGIAVFVIIVVAITFGVILLCVCCCCLCRHFCCKSKPPPQTTTVVI